jgi:hypothetical protein
MRFGINCTLALLTISLSTLCACSAVARHHHALVHEFRSEIQSADPISGEWGVSFLVNGQTTPATFNLKLDGKKVTGSAFSDHTGAGTVRDGVWENGKLSFTLDFKKHESIIVTGSMKESKLVGQFSTEGFTANWEASKN